ncbi:MAG: flagellar biosynthetic protein FliO [Christensenellaceae bacterium]|nr:flagellar biosynthetic protein FliO [Christensenellaceae bacterium]MEA5064526.1 flagellar biosynthetic protein FliO [Eubacteriales bacterium]MEA5068630.1 flagellar biosynthetic protein FliO [Christensenellaceae bacterium]
MAEAGQVASLVIPMLSVVAVIVLVYALTRWLVRRQPNHPGGRRIKVIERVPLTRDSMLALVEVDAQTYLLSAGPDGVKPIAAMSGGKPPENFEAMVAKRAGDAPR